ncbi:MAG: aspartate-semialdehyde dehydrogenase [Candidatus Diapherotrites archaeon]|nr:aspartate-semialdehyde dehydrogenase [Candidatus Diapherotrites archaeon]
MAKIKVGVLGATGAVGQQYISLLENHPWFEVSYVAASPSSAGKKYKDAVKGRWLINKDIPKNVADLVVEDANVVEKALGQCNFVFSALEMDKQAIMSLEEKYASLDIPVVSNASAHRHTEDVPMLIPEINPNHIDIIPIQRKRRGWKKGFIVVKPNCSLQSYLTPIYALIKNGYDISEVILTTMQAVSGAGYPGVASLDIIDNIIPFISGEEEKSEIEPLKILGEIKDNKFVYYDKIKISAHCNRVPVIDGHMACVSIKFRSKKPAKEEILNIWQNFKSEPQKLNLPFAPEKPIIYINEDNRPQPRKDRMLDKGMAVAVGRLRECKVFDYRFVGLSHNTIRGAAGGGILNAELLKAKGYL